MDIIQIRVDLPPSYPIFDIIIFRQRACLHMWLCGSVGPLVGPRKTLTVLIGFQTANRNHLKSHEVAVRVTMYV